MNFVKVNKSELLTKLKANLVKHKADYDAALAGFRETLIEELTKHLKEATEHPPTKFFEYQLKAPQSQAKEYERVIAMLEMSLDNEIDLSHQEFQHYVMDDWRWKEEFEASNIGYMNKFRGTR